MDKTIRTAPEIRFPGFKEPWEQRRLGNLGTTFTGLSGKAKQDFGHGEAQFVTYMNVYTNPISKLNMTEHVEIDNRQNKVQFGDIFFTTSSETPEEVGMSSVWLDNSDNTYLNSFCFGFRPKTSLSPYYMAYMLRSAGVREKIIFLAQGISRYNISKNRMMNIEVPLPTLNEQEKIGAFFKSVDALIFLHQRKHDFLQELKRGMLQVMFPQKGEKVPKVRFPGFTSPWEQRKFGDVFEEYSDKGYPNLPALTIIQGGGTIRRNESDRNLQYDKNNLANYKKVEKGDFIVHLRSFEGGLEKATDCGVISPAYHTFHGEGTDSRFYYCYFRSNKFINHDLKPHVYGIRDGRSIDIESMKTIKIPWTNLEEQKAIGDYIDCIDSLITLHQRKLEQLREMKKGLLQKMFI